MDTKVLGGPEALLEAAVCPEADTVVTAVVGMVGLRPTLAAIRERKRIALANKETLVCAGQLVMDAADTHGARSCLWTRSTRPSSSAFRAAPTAGRSGG